MNQIKKITSAAAIMLFLAVHPAFSAVQKEAPKSEPSAPVASTTTASAPSDAFFNDQDSSVLNRLQSPPSDNKNTPTNNPQNNPQNNPEPEPPDQTEDKNLSDGTSEVWPVDHICPQGYYCRINQIPVLGTREGREGTCAINDIEVDNAYRDCAKVKVFCQNPLPKSEKLYQRLCS